MPLTDHEIEQITPRDKPFRLYDTHGLYLEISPKGGKWWRLKYRFEGKEKTLALGVHPAVSLLEARTSRDAARTLLNSKVDPSEQRKEEKARRVREAPPSFRLSLDADGGITIQTKTGSNFRLTHAQTEALRAFLASTESKTCP